MAQHYTFDQWERKKEYSRKWFHDSLLKPEGRFKNLIRKAKQRKYRVFLTLDEFIQLENKPCYYCGENKQRSGIDRVDNEKDYLFSNCVPCCAICNYMKKGLHQDTFIAYCKKIALYGLA